MKPILNIADIPLADQDGGEKFAAQMGQFGPLIGMKQLGCRLVVVPPGKAAWPFHCHHVNEEMFVLLEGEGTLRLGEDRHAVKAGDVIACPAGGPETAHQLVNTSDKDMRYLAISTMLEPEVGEYPDSGKFLVMSGAAPGGNKAERRLWYVGRSANTLDYLDGE